MDGGRSRCDLLIRNALLFDGSGDAPSVQDLAVTEGRISMIGARLDINATQQIDAKGLWLMPGLLDVHTHFDLEVELEPGLPEAVRHGSTTVVVSNCSLGLAFGSQRRDGADPIVDCFARVENLPKTVLRKVADQVDWSDSRDYLEHLDSLPLGPNVVPMIPHSMLRIEVMGLNDSVRRKPSEAELLRMEQLLEKGMREGYVGFSTDALPFHFLANQPNTRKQIPTQFAPYAELKRLTGVVRRWGRLWQATPPKDRKLAVIRNFMLTSGRLFGRTLKVTAVAAMDFNTNGSLLKMALLLSRVLNSKLVRGRFRFQALAAPFTTWSDGVVTPLAEEIPCLRVLNELDLDDRAGRRKLLDDPEWIADFRRMWFHGKRGFSLARLARLMNRETNVLSRDLRDMAIDRCPVALWSGESLQAIYERALAFRAGDASQARSIDERDAFASMPAPLVDDADFLLHLLRRYDTALRWKTTTANRDAATTKSLMFNPLLLPGFNDSGAHLTNMAFYDGNLRTLKLAQADGVEKVAHAVHRLTAEPAEYFGLDAGRVAVGAAADLVLIDPLALQLWVPETTVDYVWRACFEHHQLVNRPAGVVAAVAVGGKLLWRDGAYLPGFGVERAGRVMRHRDHVADGVVAAA
ncbi:MAG: N-acyl-D-glutamate deacylase [Hydrocarboniphaga sp.]|uniref:N-acyl-D-amino-acid deacylase family protein n=1 Tax=Hydrocarboniphaga sp. TaxID=2033016 RepID=UPI002632379F|nr:amidohydrolase family protein [Hydrocarboniphaga sp.]MDB5969478.1 N-acyl-D-glutamate deacylase [Hydrocarboniphaga sp.]